MIFQPVPVDVTLVNRFVIALDEQFCGATTLSMDGQPIPISWYASWTRHSPMRAAHVISTGYSRRDHWHRAHVSPDYPCQSMSRMSHSGTCSSGTDPARGAAVVCGLIPCIVQGRFTKILAGCTRAVAGSDLLINIISFCFIWLLCRASCIRHPSLILD
jgi:hypothetical protein